MTSSKIPPRINLYNKQPPFLDHHGSCIRIWTMYNHSVTSGSYYEINLNTGDIDLVTQLNGNPINSVRMISGATHHDKVQHHSF